MTTVKWMLRWTLRKGGELVHCSEGGLRNLRECRSRLLGILQKAEADGLPLIDADAAPELACGTVRLFGTTTMRGVARCGVL